MEKYYIKFNEYEPKYVQIAENIKKLINSRVIKDGDKLPPIRELSKSLKVNNVTIVSCYNKLVAEGYAYQKMGSGTFAKKREIVDYFKKEYSKEIKETAANLRIIDDALFRLMGEKPGVCEEILRTLLDMPHLQVVKVSVQSVVQSFQREITLDALCMTQDGRYCNVEVQKGNSNDDIRRTRFHAAALTAKYTPKGADFKNVPDVTIVYISEYDVLKNNQTVTHVTRCMKNDESYVPVKDGEDIIFANTCVNDGSDKSELLQLMLNKEAFYNDKFPQISNAISYFKETEGGQSEMCKIVEDYAKEYAKNSIQEAIEAKKLADEAKKLAEEEKRKAEEAESRAGKAIERNYRLIVNILSGRTYEEAADMLGISIEDVKEAEAAIKAIDK